MTETPDFILFLGRFHPLVVHLPIGFLLMAIIMELGSRLPQFKGLKPAISFAWLLGAISAVVAVVLGYLLSLGGGYNPDTLFWHQWAGIAVAVLSSAIYVAGRKDFKFRHFFTSQANLAIALVTGGLLTMTGHLGGNLTHGSTYLLEHAPNPIRMLAGLPVKESRGAKQITSLDSADVFVNAIVPIMEARCVSCHNEDKVKGELLLTSFDNIMKGGESGPSVVPGDLDGSEIYRRITLPQGHDDFMPTDGKEPLTEEQVTIIGWWIANGAVQAGTVSSLDPDEEMIALFTDYFGINADGLLSMEAPPVNMETIDSLKAQGFQFYALAEESNLIEADLHISGRQANDVDMSALLGLKAQLVWLQLPNCGVEDRHLEVIGQLTELRKLNLNKNSITDEGIKSLSNLTQLEYLNLYGNEIGDPSMDVIKTLPNLTKLYLRETRVSVKAIEALQKERPELLVFYEAPELM